MWVGLSIPELLERVGISKYSGLDADPLLFSYALFGSASAHSIRNLIEVVGKDELLPELLPELTGLNDKSLRYLLKRIEPKSYQELQGGVIETLQRDPRMASRPDGVVAGDDTIECKSGVKMPGIQVLFKASEGRYALAYAIPSTHYADDEQDYPLLFEIRRRSEAEEKAVVDLRKTDDYLAWVDHQIAQGEKPVLAVLRGARFNRKAITAVEDRDIPWLAISPKNRTYQDRSGKPLTTKQLLRRRMNERVCVQLSDSGRQVLVEEGQMAEGEPVFFLITNDVARDERTLFVVRRGESDAETALALLETYLSWEQVTIETKLHQMVSLVTQVRAYGIQAETASFDRWFFVSWFIQEVLHAGYQRVVVPDRADRTYSYQGQQMTGKEIRATIAPDEFQPAHYKRKRCLLASRLVGYGEVGQVKLVFVEEFNKKDQPTRRYALLCTDSAYDNELVYRAHKLRWKIEEGYREMRQHHGLSNFHSRNWNAIYGHIAFTFLSLLLTIAIRRFNQRIATQTLGWVKQYYLNAVVELQVRADRLIIRFNPGFLQQFGLFQLVPNISYVDW
jgi:hypothetical protein